MPLVVAKAGFTTLQTAARDEQFRTERPDRRTKIVRDGLTGGAKGHFDPTDPLTEQHEEAYNMHQGEKTRLGLTQLKHLRFLRTAIASRRAEDPSLFPCRCKFPTDLDATAVAEARLTCQCAAIYVLHAQWDNHGLRYTTIAEYGSRLISHAKDCGEPFTPREYKILHDLRTIYNGLGALSRKDSGTAIGIQEGNEVLARLDEAGEHDIATCLYLMGVTGVRWDDVSTVTYGDITFDTFGGIRRPRVSFYSDFGKTSRDAQTRHTAHGEIMSCGLKPPKGFDSLMVRVQNAAKYGTQSRVPFGHITTKMVDDILRRLGETCRTKHWRKHYAAMMKVQCGDDDEKHRRILNHSNRNMAGAFYFSFEGEIVIEEYRQLYKRRSGFTLEGGLAELREEPAPPVVRRDAQPEAEEMSEADEADEEEEAEDQWGDADRERIFVQQAQEAPQAQQPPGAYHLDGQLVVGGLFQPYPNLVPEQE